MGILNYALAKRKIGTFEPIAINMANAVKGFGISSFASEAEAVAVFSIVLGQRAEAAMLIRRTNGNLLLDNGIDKFYRYWEEALGNKFLLSMKLDLPSFVFTAMFFESQRFREGLKMADPILRNEIFDIIFVICQRICPAMVRLPGRIYRENMKILLSYLLGKGIS